MSYLKLNIKDPEENLDIIKKLFFDRDTRINNIRYKIQIYNTKSKKSRKLFAVDSGYNSAYETPFTIFRAAIVDDNVNVIKQTSAYLFHVSNQQIDRLKRLLSQQSLYEVLYEKVKSGSAENSIVIVDGTISPSPFSPTSKDNSEYRSHFELFLNQLFTPLIEECLERNIILLGFLKRTGSTYITEHYGMKRVYDKFVISSLLRKNGQYIKPIPISHNFRRNDLFNYSFVTFYSRLKQWCYRFELLQEQESFFLECIENLLYWATESHHGMNPILSKADEHARLKKKEANNIFDYIIHNLSRDEQAKLRREAKYKTHFGHVTNPLTYSIV